MEKTEFAKLKRIIFTTGIIYICLVAVIMSLAVGFSLINLLGLAIGFGTMMVNVALLGNVVTLFRRPGMRLFAVLIYFLRLAIYGVAAVICFFLGKMVLIAFAAGVLALMAGAIVYMIKEGRLND